MAVAASPAAALAGGYVPSTPDLGKAEGRCRADEPGPALLINVLGLKDRKGLLKVEVYPPDDDGWLADDNLLVGAGKTFRRVEIATPPSGPATLCVRVPGPGAYTLMVLHDRDANHKITISSDGFGVPQAQHFRYRKPRAAEARVMAGPGLTRINVTLAYRSGLFSFDPIGGR
ncbi:MAG: DUF2141 domain-containing protein [Proteobacteria bacterium]|nr:DUF2141 domain-containing protein [Pseudomonadota bacterium]